MQEFSRIRVAGIFKNQEYIDGVLAGADLHVFLCTAKLFEKYATAENKKKKNWFIAVGDFRTFGGKFSPRRFKNFFLVIFVRV